MKNNFYDRQYYKGLKDKAGTKKTSPAKKKEIEFFKKIICPRPGEKILDLGCGTGNYLEGIKNTGADLWGIDISFKAVAVAKAKVLKAKQILCGDACPLPFPDTQFDCVTAWGVIEHFSDIAKIIVEVKRVVKPNGTVIIMVPNVYYYKFIWDTLRKGSGPVKHQEIEKLYSYREWKVLIESQGLKVTSTFCHNKFNKSKIIIWLRNKTIPFYFSNHFIFVCRK